MSFVVFEDVANSALSLSLLPSWPWSARTCRETSSTCTCTRTTWTSSPRWRTWSAPASICRTPTSSRPIGRAAAPWGSTGLQWPPGGSCTPTPNTCLSASGRFTNPAGCSSTRR
ncbi:hypothetical protein EYF80_066334 [Liparis tanakae]|uniref:Uncharacterized protein n=1 Tax=Liparis tanakae TaxID=230148 RepID=A0A4Z2E4K1_9TELE|nr:hypothetical protein EYF80_066334 [Liparis tanakae]